MEADVAAADFPRRYRHRRVDDGVATGKRIRHQLPQGLDYGFGCM